MLRFGCLGKGVYGVVADRAHHLKMQFWH